MLATLVHEALPALRVAATCFLIINILAAVYFYRNRRRFFYRDPNVDGDVEAVRWLRVLGIVAPWCALTTRLAITLVQLWAA
jgi:hypothetical protein